LPLPTLQVTLIAAPVPLPDPPQVQAVPLPQPEPKPVRRAPRPRPVALPAPQTITPPEAPPAPEAPPVEAPPAPPRASPAAAVVAAPVAEPVVAARFDAAYLDNPAPRYPPISRRIGETGKVMLRVFVSAEGRPEQLELKAGSGSPRLDSAALEAVRRWRFVPARQGERAVASWVLVPIVFKLENS
jgi:protein TonB